MLIQINKKRYRGSNYSSIGSVIKPLKPGRFKAVSTCLNVLNVSYFLKILLQIRLRIPDAPRSGRVVLESKNLGHHYEAKEVFHNLNFHLERNSKVALAGVNGAGKTTLLKILAGELKPAEGEFQLGHNVFPAYYAQMVTDQLDLKNTVLARSRTKRNKRKSNDTPFNSWFIPFFR